ncbi:hypothetical protein JAAARDRAFT_197382 [Jaapia argillacea MUCL 33604]|uniref:T6SS Phospholipase effector Tle1-like catalytic domain-containing protein n=1 Tax=Jaapia argillacea MUCL 33604 TaxID=933084 RepID=A0A067PF90_9AGAM|nr:hypothetical protein JAAARDRAFT_197382 [Jaapia argillacea MUCL 33604]
MSTLPSSGSANGSTFLKGHFAEDSGVAFLDADVVKTAPSPISPASTQSTTQTKTSPTSPAWQGLDAKRRWIPDDAQHPTRTLVLCFDGTGDQFDETNSNIVQLTAMLRKDDTTKQLVYYQTGIGTYASPLAATPLLAGAYETADQMFAFTLESHIRGGYKFLMDNYTDGDSICIFGFSRGAYTARALAGMLQKVGLLSKGNAEQMPFAFDMYKRDDVEGLKLSIMFKRTFSIDVKIDFLGVWDTVASVGLRTPRLPFVGTNNAIRVFRHALALDEHRTKFMPSFYKQSTIMEKQQPTATGTNTMPTLRSTFMRVPGFKGDDHDDDDGDAVNAYENEVNHGSVTDYKEVFFAGAHCDVGGGSVENGTHNSLARIPLRWMIRECFRSKTGLIFDADMLRLQVGLDIDTIASTPPPRVPPSSTDRIEVVDPKMRSTFLGSVAGAVINTITLPFQLVASFFKPKVQLKSDGFDASNHVCENDLLTEQQQELKDALSPIYDQLYLVWWWWIFEKFPTRHVKQLPVVDPTKPPKRETVIFANNGQGRKIFKHVVERDGGKGLHVHRSVRTRLEALDAHGRLGTYVPLIRPNFPEYVDAKDDSPRLTYEQWMTDERIVWVDE